MKNRCWPILVSLLALLVMSLSSAQKPLEGVELTLLIHPTLYAASGGDEGVIAEFEEETGASVEVVTAPIPEHSEKAMVEFIAGTGRYDVIAMQNSDFTSDFNPFFLPLDAYIAQDAETWAWDDIIPALAETAEFDGQQLGIPYRWGANVVYFRKDLFEAAGLAPPTTFDELREVGKALTQDTDGDGTIDVYGYVQRGKAPSELAHDFLHAFYGAGGTFFNDDGRCGFDSEAGIMAAQLWRDLFEEDIFPPDMFAWGRDDYITAMQQGRAAAGSYVWSYFNRFLGEDSELEPGQLGWALNPTAPGVPAGRARGGGWHLIISKESKNSDAAWELIKALTNQENQLLMALEYGNGPIRASVFESDAFKEVWPQAPMILEATANQVTDPNHPAVPRIQEILSEELTDIMRGDKTPEQGMARVCERANDVIEDYE